jgi:hypothetical protein
MATEAIGVNGRSGVYVHPLPRPQASSTELAVMLLGR